MANKIEIENGSASIGDDIDSEKLNGLIKSYTNDFDDYLYIVAEKFTS